MFRFSTKVFSVVVLVVLAGCVSFPTGPNIMALPGTGVPFEQFRNDDAQCEQYASSQIVRNGSAGSEYEMQQRYDVAYVQCMYAKGHKVPVSGQFSGAIPQNNAVVPSENIPPPPPGIPPPPPGMAPAVLPK